MIAWDSSLATGDAMIDAQHQELYRIVNELHEACAEGVAQDRVDQVLGRLLFYTIEHFSAEENLMLRASYPAGDIRAHVAQHTELKRRVGELVAEREAGRLKTAMPVVELVHEWLGTHINHVDRRLVNYVQSH